MIHLIDTNPAFMFPSSFDDLPRPRPVSDATGFEEIQNPKSFLSSFMPFRSSPQDDDRRQEDRNRQRQRQRSFNPTTFSLQSHLLPQSLLGDEIFSASIPRPRTVTDDVPITDDSSRNNSSVLLPPPRRPWGIASDVHKALPKLPRNYPPLDPNCTALVTDVPPSIVLVRISECLRRRSIAAEYDDDSVTARCMTVDRVHFSIQLYRAPVSSFQDETLTLEEDTAMALPYDTVIVEIQKLTCGSSSLSFHAACAKILLAAKGLDTGDDERPSHRRNRMEFKPRSIAKRQHPSSISSTSRLLKRRKPTLVYETTDSPAGHLANRTLIAEESLEEAIALLQKDRFECQQFGMERLVNLTDPDSVGNEVCRHVCRRLLLQEQEQAPDNGSLLLGGIKSSPKTRSLIDFLMHPGAEQASVLVPSTKFDQIDSRGITSSRQESKNNRMIRSFLESSALSAVTPPSKKHSPDRRNVTTSSTSFSSPFRKKRSVKRLLSPDAGVRNQSKDQMSPDELRHEARLRSLAMRVFCNALDFLSGAKMLQEILHPPVSNRRTNHEAHQTIRKASRWVKPPFLLSLVQDLQGAGRPPSVSETGYKLASVHEAAMVARCLRLLAGYDGDESSDDEDSNPRHHHQHKTSGASFGEEQEAVRDFLRSEAVLERLQYARTCGRTAHAVLQYEAESTYNKLTEDDRSC